METTLKELTNRESGIIWFGENNCQLVNWATFEHIPYFIDMAICGDLGIEGEPIETAEPIAIEDIPTTIVEWIAEYCGLVLTSDKYHAWLINGNITVITHDDWN